MVDERAKQDALFVNLVMLFKEAALQHMGKLVNPITGKVEKNLDQARFSIDTLDMLKAKTAGNLSDELERLLDTTLIELRMNYIAEVESDSKTGKQESSGDTEAGSEKSGLRADSAECSEAGSEKRSSVCCEEHGEKDEEVRSKVTGIVESGEEACSNVGDLMGHRDSTCQDQTSLPKKRKTRESASKKKSGKAVGRKARGGN